MTKIAPRKYNKLLKDIKEHIRAAQYETFKAVNKRLVNLYWDIGQMITDRQNKEGWGKSVVEQLSKDLQKEFPGVKGFSVQNLWYMRQFYLAYKDNKKLQPLVGEIAWSHNLIIMSKCKDNLQREFYIKMTRKFGWTKDVVIHQVENQTYEKTLLSKTNFDKAVSKEICNQAKLAVKDEYIFDFLELGEEHTERELEKSLLLKMEYFLKEMGGFFAFIGSQYRLEVEDNEYFIDILLYHRVLKSLVALEIKVGEFKPEYVGKMQFYLAVLDDKVRLENENPPIGIIICKSKKKTIVEYSLKESNKPIGVSEYKTMSKLPADLQKQLPSPEQIAKLLDII